MADSNPSADLVREELQKILASPGFARNERLGQFLRFVVENQLQGTPEHLKEFTVGVEVFGRKLDYDPKLDSIVRTEAARLRKRLAEYYEANGASHKIIIELPKGGYVPVFHTGAAPAVRRASFLQKTSIVAAATALLALLAAGLLFLAQKKTRAPVVAVLPLKNLSNDAEQDYFAEGMTEELITTLGKISALRVISRQSVMRYKGSKRPLPEIAGELNVDAVVEGSVLRSGDRVRITANLLYAPTDRQLWAETYDRDLGYVLALYSEVARAIAREIRVAVTPAEEALLAATRPVNPEAY